MLKRHSHELLSRLERAADVGCAEIFNSELLRWYDQQKVTRNVWRDLHDNWLELGEEETPLFVGWSGDRWVLIAGAGLTASTGSWLKDVREYAKREGALAEAA
jgi:hypothetical protein